jgi:DNA invertase Pin-like site-specific DNA recombinase
MQNYNNEQNQEYDYRGKRGLILLRVSTEEQEKKYGLAAQLRSIREKLIEPRGIRIPNEETHIIRDTYTGMEFQDREVLHKIREMAQRGEFDVLVMDVLDRLGRVGMPREIYRAELKMLGIHFLTTKEEEHADDDSMLGQMIRLWHGWKSEGERNDIIRRTQNGKRERVLKDNKLLGTPGPKYGWKFKDGDKGAYILNNDPITIELDNERILLDEDGEPWTPVKVRQYMFHTIDNGGSIKSIVKYLSSHHIPTSKGGRWEISLVRRILNNRHSFTPRDQPILAYGYLTVLDENGDPWTEASVAQLIYELNDKGMNEKNIVKLLNEKRVPTGRETAWEGSTVSYMLEDEFVIGKAAAYKQQTIKIPGKKKTVKKTPKDQWVYLPEGTVPPILVTEDGKPDIALFERVQSRLAANQKSSLRNNKSPHNYLLRGGYAKCGYCGGTMQATKITAYTPGYRCNTTSSVNGKCKMHNAVSASVIDPIAWEEAVKLIRDPSKVDQEVEARRTQDPNAEKRQHLTNELAKVNASRARLTKRLEDEDLDDETYADIKRRLKELAEMKRGYETALNTEIDIHEEWRKTQEKLNHFHQRCQEMREKLDDPEFIADHKFKREAIEFFGIVVWVWKTDHRPRFEIELYTPSLASNTPYGNYPRKNRLQARRDAREYGRERARHPQLSVSRPRALSCKSSQAERSARWAR